MHFNPEITLGTVVEITIFLFGLIGTLMHFNQKLGALTTKVNIMYHWFDRVIMRGVTPYVGPAQPPDAGEVKKFYGGNPNEE